jgi:hypothetical protein
MKRNLLLITLLILLTSLNGFSQYNPPQNFQCDSVGRNYIFTWEEPETGDPIGYNIYRNNEIINPQLIPDQTFTWFSTTGCPSDFDIEAVYQFGISEKVSLLYPEEVYAGLLEPYIFDGVCWGIEIVEFPCCDISGYAFRIDDAMWSYLNDLPSNPIIFADPLPSGAEFCIEYTLSECIAMACCTVPVITSTEESPEPEINIFPQPATSVINITSSIPIIKIEILNLTGEKTNIYNPNGVKEWKANIKHLNSGVYIIRYVLEDNQAHFRKIIVR